jgi:uncharacterized protein (TIGR03083 family)
MESHVNQAELLERLAREHERLEAVLAQLTPEECMTQRIAGDWTIQDILAHLIAHEQRALQELHSARRGEPLMIDHSATDRFNAEAVQALRGKSYEEVYTMWSASYHAAVMAVRSLSADDFAPTSLTVTTLGDSIDGALGNNTYEHAAEHRREIERWLERS